MPVSGDTMHTTSNLWDPMVGTVRAGSFQGGIEAYFVGPQNPGHHSKWPTFLRVHGSVMPLMIVPLLFVTSWAAAVTLISHYIKNLGINPVLLTVLGFVVGLSLSFRSSTAYERYNEGRKYWTQLATTAQGLARLIWIHVDEREGHNKDDLIGKVTCCNMLTAYAFALKHRLRFEPFTHYQDLNFRIRHLDIMAQTVQGRDLDSPSPWRLAGWVLGLPMADSNPRKLAKSSRDPLGNIPLEILNHCSAYIKSVIDNGTLRIPIYQTQAMTYLTQLNEILNGTERILNTPLPVAYSIAFAQITWIYILTLPFQLLNALGWFTIPATVFAAYIILGIALIGHEIENPFGDGVNDLSLDLFCQHIQHDMNIITSCTPPRAEDFSKRGNNAFLYPMEHSGYDSMDDKSLQEIRDLLRRRVKVVSSETIVNSPKEDC